MTKVGRLWCFRHAVCTDKDVVRPAPRIDTFEKRVWRDIYGIVHKYILVNALALLQTHSKMGQVTKACVSLQRTNAQNKTLSLLTRCGVGSGVFLVSHNSLLALVNYLAHLKMLQAGPIRVVWFN